MTATIHHLPVTPRLARTWPRPGNLVETMGHCAKVLKVEGVAVKVEIDSPLWHAATWVHVSRVKPWVEPMTRAIEGDMPCDTEPKGAV